MTNIEKALEKIQEASANSNRLDLSGLELYTEDLENLLPAIALLEHLDTLILNGNELTSFPANIGVLSGLTTLDLSQNNFVSLEGIGKLVNLQELDVQQNQQLTSVTSEIGELKMLNNLNLGDCLISELPPEIGQLGNLRSLYISDNEIGALPEEIGLLESLETLEAAENNLRVLPESLGNLGIDALDLRDNPLTPETRTWLSNVFADIELLTNMAAQDEEVDPDAVLQVLYGEDADKMLEGIEYSNHELDVLGPDEQPNKTAPKEAIFSFLKGIPLEDPLSDRVYLPAVKRLLDDVLNPHKTVDERNTALQTIFTSLGDCTTPIKSLMMQEHIGRLLHGKGEMDAIDMALLQREAIQEQITIKLGGLLQQNERIEQVEGLLNLIYLEGAEQYEENPISIQGNRNFLPSKTAYPGFAFSQLSGERREPLIAAFTALVCKTNEQGVAIREQGSYVLDPTKIKTMTEGYLSARGLISESEKQVTLFAAELQDFLQRPENSALAIEHYGHPEVEELINVPTLKERLRNALGRAEANELEGIRTGFQKGIQLRVKKILSALEKDSRREHAMGAMGKPMNEKRRLPSPSPPHSDSPKNKRQKRSPSQG